MSDSFLCLPEDFDDYEWEVEAKGCFLGAALDISGATYRVNFYDPVRLQQEIQSALQHGFVFLEPNLLVIHAVNRANMERAAELIGNSHQLKLLVPEAVEHS